MLLPKRQAGWPQAKVYYLNQPDYDKDAAWLRKKLRTTGGKMYFSAGEARHQVYSQLEDDFRFASEENYADIHFVAGPVLNIPEADGLNKKQEGRENLSPIVRLAKDEKIKLYAADKRVPYTFRIFEDIESANVLESYAPGENTSGAWYFYNWWVEAMSWKHHFDDSVRSKKPLRDSFLDNFLFLTDKETEELKRWSYNKHKDIRNIDLDSCREFWREYTR